jgi:D-aminopeptidase
MSEDTKPRARDLGLPFKGSPGRYNAITDVPGVQVGFTTLNQPRDELAVGSGPVRTGVTAILPRENHDRLSPVWAGLYSLNGNGEMTGTHWIQDAGYFTSPICITNTHSVGVVHHATVRWMIDRYSANFIDDHAWAMPVVAETYDGLTNDICGQHVTEDHVFDALNGARGMCVAEGNVGGGTGMMSFEFKGGTGTSSRQIEIDDEQYTVAALVQSNFGSREEFEVLGVPVGECWPENAPLTEMTKPKPGSIIVIIATDIPLLPIQLKRLAKRGAMGIARTGSPGGHYSGDIILAFSVANDIGLPRLMNDEQPGTFDLAFTNDHYCDDIYEAAVQSVEEAIINAMIAAESMPIVKPAGFVFEAIDHDRLKDIMRQYNRLIE